MWLERMAIPSLKGLQMYNREGAYSCLGIGMGDERKTTNMYGIPRVKQRAKRDMVEEKNGKRIHHHLGMYIHIYILQSTTTTSIFHKS